MARAIILMLLLASGSLASPSLAQELPPLTGKDVKFRVNSPPAGLNFYPTKALRAEIEGKATTNCIIAQNGTLADCAVIEEVPLGCAFGDAALKLNRHMVIAPLANDGSPTPGRAFRFELTLKVPGGAIPKADNCD